MKYPILESFLEYLQNNKKKSELTVKSYRNDLMQLHTYLQSKYTESNFTKRFYKNLSIIDLDGFISYLTQDKIIDGKTRKGNAPASINRRITAIKEFYKYMKRCKIIQDDISQDLECLKLPLRLHITVDEDDSVKLLKEANNEKNKNRIRDTTIILVLLATGMRVSELLNLKSTYVQDEVLKIIGKGNKERYVFLSEVVLDALNEYSNYKKENNIESEYLFVSKSGIKLATSNVDDMIKKHSKAANIKDYDKISAHKFRHSFATSGFANGMDVVSLQEILGHSSLNTTRIYIKTTQAKLKEAINKNPLANINYK